MKFLIVFLGKCEGLIKKCKHLILIKTNGQYKEVEKWYKTDPKELKKITFNTLGKNSIIFDLGGYEGQWTSDLYSQYLSSIFIFEPVKKYADIIQNRFKKNPNINVYDFGLAEKTFDTIITIDEFASSILKNSQDNSSKEKIQLKEFSQFLKDTKIDSIDLIKINIEGAEYNLLEYLILNGSIKKIKIILIQFHNFVENAEKRRSEIQNSLSITHHKTFDAPFVWECWRINE